MPNRSRSPVKTTSASRVPHGDGPTDEICPSRNSPSWTDEGPTARLVRAEGFDADLDESGAVHRLQRAGVDFEVVGHAVVHVVRLYPGHPEGSVSPAGCALFG